jgi:hypothetical protein
MALGLPRCFTLPYNDVLVFFLVPIVQGPKLGMHVFFMFL